MGLGIGLGLGLGLGLGWVVELAAGETALRRPTTPNPNLSLTQTLTRVLSSRAAPVTAALRLGHLVWPGLL